MYSRCFGKAPAAPAEFRGGLGHVIELGGAGAAPIALLWQFRACAQPGVGTRRRPARCIGRGGAALRPSHPAERAADRACARRLPGGGGFGDPYARDPQRVIDDVLDGLITAEEARRDYGVAIDALGRLDPIETKRCGLVIERPANDRAEHGGGRGPSIREKSAGV